MSELCGRKRPRLEPSATQSEPDELQSEASLEPSACWQSKHTIFLSHSGAQKDFTRHLFEALRYAHRSPFLDVDADSLTKGEKWLPTLMEAAKQCRVAVLVLSDEYFTRSKWPMMELNVFAKAQNANLKILPLFLKLSLKQFDEVKRKKEWFEKWKAMKADDGRIDLNEWEHALSIVKKYGAMSYENEGEPAFIKKVVDAICKLVEPDVKFDVPDNHSTRHLCLPILRKLEKVAPSPTYKVHVMGLFGMGGIGKTTISRAICNQKFEDLGGKVCHVEFGSKSLVELQKTVLKELTQADPTILDNQHGKLPDLLKKRMYKQRVFLVLDNVQGHEVDEVMMYLNVGYAEGSTVLVTSRSQDILVQQLHIRECDCLEVPQLDADGAVDVFLYYIGLRKPINEKEMDIIRRYVDECSFVKQGHAGSKKGKKPTKQYLPLALKVLGSQLQSIASEAWGLEKYLEKHVEKLEAEKFNLLRERKHPIFSVLRLGYDALCQEDQHIFLDLALLWTPRWRSWSFELGCMWEWMCIIHRTTKDSMKESVNALKRNGLLDIEVEHDELKCNIHDLYIDLAEAEARTGPFKKRRFLFDNKGSTVPFELLRNPSGLCWPSLERLIIYNNKVQSLKKAKLNLCSNVEVLYLYGCEELVEVDLGGLENLRSMEVVACSKLGQSTHGIEKLSNLVLFHMAHCVGPFVPQFLASLSSLTALMVLNLEVLPISTLPDFSNLQQLEVTNITYCEDLTSLGGIIKAHALQKLDASNCINLKELPGDLSGLKQLEKLDVHGCHKLERLGGIGSLEALRELNAFWCKNLEELPDDLSGLKQLEKIDVHGCYKLERLGGIGSLGALRELNASWCGNLEELPGDLSGLKQLEKLDVSDCEKLKRLGGIGGLRALRELNASCCRNLEELPSDLSGLKQLEKLDVHTCRKLERLGGIGSLGALRELNASWCRNLEELPSDLSGLKQLEKLDVSDCEKLKRLGGIGGLEALRELNASQCGNLEELPGDLSGLKQLEKVGVNGCYKLERLEGIGGLEALQELNASCCGNLEELPSDLSGLKQLEKLDVRKCCKLERLGGIGSLGALRELNASWCRNVEELPDDLNGLKQLERIDVNGCCKLKRLVGIGSLGALRELNASQCGNLVELPGDLSGLKQLEKLSVNGCYKLERLEGIGGLGALRELNASWCMNLEELPSDLSGLKHLEKLVVSSCEKLKRLEDIGSLGALRELNVYSCKNLEELPRDLSGLKQLEKLTVSECKKLKWLGGIGDLWALRELNASCCENLEELPGDLSGLKQLEKLDVRGCGKLENLGGIGGLKALRELNASRCTNLEELPGDLSGLKQLEKLVVSNCEKLRRLGGIGGLEVLRELNASCCMNLEELPADLSGLKQLEKLDVRGCYKLEELRGIGGLEALR